MEKLLITEHTKNFLIGIYILMSVFTLISFFMKKSDSEKIKSFGENFNIRLRSFWTVVVIFTLAFIGNKLTACILIAGVSFLALREYIEIVPHYKNNALIKTMSGIAVIYQMILIYTDWLAMFYIFVPLYMFLVMPICLIIQEKTQDFLKNCAIIHWGLMSTVYAVGYLAVYLDFWPGKNPTGGGLGILLCILFLTVFNDFAQYAFGKAFGKHKITPKVSPNKTWEGFVGGLLTTVLCTFLFAPYLTPLTRVDSLWIGLLISIAAFFGDLTMSAIKRDAGVKDSGTLLPGHGGILDRLDSLIFTAPVFYHSIAYIVHLR